MAVAQRRSSQDRVARGDEGYSLPNLLRPKDSFATETSNFQRSTSNVQHLKRTNTPTRKCRRSDVGHWTLNVGRWTLNVFCCGRPAARRVPPPLYLPALLIGGGMVGKNTSADMPPRSMPSRLSSRTLTPNTCLIRSSTV